MLCAGFAQKTFIPYAETFGESFVQGRVELVDTDRQLVILEGGRVRTTAAPCGASSAAWGGGEAAAESVSFVPQEIQYSHLILCTGTDGPFPGKFNTVASHKEAVQKYEDFIREVRSGFTAVCLEVII